MNRRQFTFASLALLTSYPTGIGFARQDTDLSLRGIWSAWTEDQILWINLNLQNIDLRPVQVLRHKGLRPAPELSSRVRRTQGWSELAFDKLTEEEEQEPRLRGGIKKKWISIASNETAHICRFRMSNVPHVKVGSELSVSAKIMIESRQIIELPTTLIKLGQHQVKM